jgi:restriction endonuclease S subunit
MRKRLSDIARIDPGYSFRGKIENDPEGEYRIIQPSNVGPAGEVDVEALPMVGEISPRDYHHASGDVVLFVAYGTRNRAYHFEDLPSNTVASSTFYILRAEGEQLLPAYLAWYLNQPPAQAYIEALRAGVSVQILRRDALGSLEMPVPPLDMQRQVAEVARLADEEEFLARQLMEKRRLYTDTFLLDKIQNT